jgi:formylglycine-generating enzyme required for sulfatase activity
MVAGLTAWVKEQALKEGVYWFTNVRGHVLTAEVERALKPQSAFTECAKDCPEMVVVPAGSFIMGSPDGLGHNDERPQHPVTIPKAFAVAKFELTFDQWDACAAQGWCIPLGDVGARPVISVNWHDAQQYVAWLSRLTGKPYRLLTEAEYEYAARARTQTAYPWGDNIGKGNANCNDCGSKWDNMQTAPVGSFSPNAFGLYDMEGNVWEWVQDCYQEDYNNVPTDGTADTADDCSRRVLRGGSWYDYPENLRSASRSGYAPASRDTIVGFRVGRTLISTSP